jgi:hypothetical protein
MWRTLEPIGGGIVIVYNRNDFLMEWNQRSNVVTVKRWGMPIGLWIPGSDRPQSVTREARKWIIDNVWGT